MSSVDTEALQTPVQARVEAAIKQMKVDISYNRLTHTLTGIVI
jgi:hypothetical protein